jgi:uncharacterized protein YabE (DUF348 family)
VKNSQTPLPINATNLIAANWLQSAGIKLFPGDSILYEGVKIDPAFELPAKQGQTLTYDPAYAITLVTNSGQSVFYSSAPTLGEALWDHGVILSNGDQTSIPLDTPVIAPVQLEINNAVPLTVQIGDKQFKVSSAGQTVGEALAQAGVALQNMDTSTPPKISLSRRTVPFR